MGKGCKLLIQGTLQKDVSIRLAGELPFLLSRWLVNFTTFKSRALAGVGALIVIFGLAVCAAAQVKVGDSVSMNLNANLQGGYTSDFSNTQNSDHGFTYGGNADLSGSYYSPNFLSFHLLPFYNESRTNSTYESISHSTGLNSTAALFSGSNTPGRISFNKVYNGTGLFAVPGGGDVTTHGDSQTLSIGWGVRIPDRPQLSFNFLDASNNNSIYGTSSESNAHSDVFSVNADHTLAGFRLRAGYEFTKVRSEVPSFVDIGAERSSSHDNVFSFGVSHRIPFNGSASLGATRSYNHGEFSSGNYNSTIDTVNAGIGLNPISNLNIGSNYQYNNNLAGTLYQSIIGAGGAPPSNLHTSSHSVDLNNYISYYIPPVHITLLGTIDHREQSLYGSSATQNSYNATATYSNSLLGGFLNLVGGVNENRTNVGDQHNTGYVTSVEYSRHVRRWEFSEGVHYWRNQQTVLIQYTSTNYGFHSNVGRRLGTYSHFSLGASGSKSKLESITGSDTTVQNFTAALSVRYVGFNAAYSKSSGNSILTSSGLVPTPVPLPVLNPSSIVMYAGKAYSLGVGANPLRHLTVSASFSKSLSDTNSQFSNSNNHTDVFTTRLEYHLRQLNFDAGYTRLRQGFSLSGGPPTTLGTFYVGISRWIDFF